MKIKSIKIEGMHNVLEKTYTFNDLNYLYGPNGAGKSTVLNAIQLALLGYIPGQNKKNEYIFQHAKSRMLSVTCKIDDDGKEIVITRTWSLSGRSVTKSFEIVPEGVKMEDILTEIEIPIYNFDSFLSLSANDMKRWFIQFLPSASGEIDWKEKLKSALGDMKLIDDDLIKDTLKQINSYAEAKEGIDLVQSVNAYLKNQQTFMKGELSRIQNTITSLVLYDDCDTDDVEGIKQHIAELQQQLSKVSKVEAVRANNARINELLKSLVTSAETLEHDERYNELNSKIDEGQSKITEITAKIEDIKHQIFETKMEISSKNTVISGKGICPYTKASCESIQKMLETEQKEKQQLLEKLSELSESLKKWENILTDSKKDVSNDLEEQTSIATIYNKKAVLQNQLQIEELIDGEEKSAEDLQSEIQTLQETLTKAAANKAYNDMSESITAEKFKIENTIQALKIWTKLTDANGLQTELMQLPFKELSEDMNKYLRKMFGKDNISCKFNLSEKANSFSFGILRDDKYVAYELLSSGEKCMYTLALMMCIIQRSSCPLKLILIDDLLDHLDDTNAAQLFESLTSIDDIQMILAGVKKYNSDNFDKCIINIQ